MRIPKTLLIIEIVLLGMFAPISTDMFLPALNDMVAYYNTTETMMGMTLYMFMFAMALGILFIGPLSDKYGRRRILVPSMILYTVMSIACSMAPTIETLILFRILQAIGGGGALAISFALVRDCFKGSEMSRMLAIMSAAGVLGPVLAPVIGTALIESMGWASTFWGPAVVSCACLLIGLMLDPAIPEERYQGSVVGAVANMKPLLTNGDFRRFTIMMTVPALCILGYVGSSSYIYQEMFGVDRAMYSGFLAAAMILGVVGMSIVTRFRNRMTNWTILILFMVLIGASTLMIPTVGRMNEWLFFASMIPLLVASSSVRAIGFDIIMSQDVGNSGALSSVINFLNYMFCTLGLVLTSMPWGNFIDGVAVCMGLGFLIYFVLWLRMRIRGTTISGF